jgi:hypothetical protein
MAQVTHKLSDRATSFMSQFQRSSTHAGIQSRTEVPLNIFERLQDQTWVEVSRGVAFRSGERLSVLGDRLKKVVDRVLFSNGLAEANDFLKQWMYAEAVCSWTLLNVQYDYDVAKNNSGLTNGYKTGQIILDMAYPKTICSGNALLTRDIARAMGLRCYYIGGWYRDIGFNFGDQSASNHAWVCFVFPDGIIVPADTTTAAFHRDNYLKRTHLSVLGKLSRDIILPTDQSAWEIFLSTYFAKDEVSHRYGDPQSKYQLISVDFNEW